MKNYSKKDITREQVKNLCQRFGITDLEASIFLRRGLSTGSELLYFLESNPRFMHQSFCFSSMEDAVDRINQAIDEDEKILIFGDKDVDGISSTAILYNYIKSQGVTPICRLPVGDDAYGLSMEAVDEFSADYGSLIITVDCGISNNAEIKHAVDLGLDVIVTDHHNPPENLPEATIIIDPKLEDSGYPFKDISGAAVAFKLVQALRFSKTGLYGQDITLLDVREDENNYYIDALKTRNLVPKDSICISVNKNVSQSIFDTELPDFLQGQQIFVWNASRVKKCLFNIFGSGVDFQMLDLENEISKLLPQVRGKNLEEIKSLSKIAFYSDEPISTLTGFYNIFVTFAELNNETVFPNHKKNAEMDLELVAIAALADIMPMKNENRLFVKSALNSLNAGRVRSGLAELFARSDFAGKKITSTDLSWKIIPLLNAAGRLGKSNIALELLISDDPQERNRKAEEIKELNEQRKIYGNDGEFYTQEQAETNYNKFDRKLCIVFDERINRGITGILAAKLMAKYNVPSIAITLNEDKTVAVGSMRSCRNLISTQFLDSFGEDFFLNHGGHNQAAGFSFYADKLNEFMNKALSLSKSIALTDEDNSIEIDAELQAQHITPELLKLIDKFEPFGEQNKELTFLSKGLPCQEACKLGKTERQHLKIMFDCGKYKFPAMFWGEGQRLGTVFSQGDKLNVIFNISRNYFNGNITPQMILSDLEKFE